LIHAGRINKEELEQEIRAVQKLCGKGHRNIVTVLHLGQLRHSSLFFIDMELCDLSLEFYLYRPTPPEPSQPIPYFVKDAPPPFRAQQIWTIMHDIASGVNFVHSHNMVHRDVKPSNGTISASDSLTFDVVLYSQHDSAWKLADFGFASDLNSRTHQSSVYARGTPSYRAPELLPLTGESAKYTKKVDIWAMGCILYEMALGYKAFRHDYATIEYVQTKRTLDLPFDEGFSQNCKNNITKNIVRMLQIEASLRPSAAELVQEFYEYIQANPLHKPQDVPHKGALHGKDFC
jgi:serine/threonine protein kinase